MSNGLFITFEGVECCGKSTQVKMLAERLEEEGYKGNVVVLREPGGTPAGEQMRQVFKHGHKMTATTELLLLSAARAELVQTVIAPALERGDLVLCDRFFDSTYAYQGYGRGISIDTISAVTTVAVNRVVPNLTLYLSIPLEESIGRRLRRAEGADRIEQEDCAFFERVGQGFEAMCVRFPLRMRRIDGHLSKDAVAALVWKEVLSLLKGR